MKLQKRIFVASVISLMLLSHQTILDKQPPLLVRLKGR